MISRDQGAFLALSSAVVIIGALLIVSLVVAPSSLASTSRTISSSTTSSSSTSIETSSQTLTSTSNTSSSMPYVVAAVPVGSSPQDPLFNPYDEDVYVSNYNNASISVISTMNSTAPEGPAIYSTVATVSVGSYPTPAVLDPANQDIYVGSLYPNTGRTNPPGAVTVLSAGGSARYGVQPIVAGIVPLGSSTPGTPIYDPADGNVYVPDGNETFVISSEMQVIRSLDFKMTQGVFDSTDNDFYFTSGGNTVSVVSGVTDALVANLTVGAGPGEPAIAPDGNVYVPDFGNDSVSIISESTNSLLTTIGVECVPLAPAFDPTTGDAYVSCGGLGGSVIVISPANQIVANVTLEVGEGLGMPVFDPSDGDMYVPVSGVSISTGGVQALQSNGGGVWAVSTKTNSPVAAAEVGYGPLTPVIDPQTGDLFVASANQSLAVLNPSEFYTNFLLGPGLHISIFTSSDSSISASVGGPSLAVSLNTTRFPTGDTIAIGVDERNDLPVGNELAAANDWAGPSVLNESGINGFFGVCGSFGLPYQGVVAQGNYALDNITAASWLQLSTPIIHGCPPEPPNPLDYVFQPSSDLAIIDRVVGASQEPAPTPHVFAFSGAYGSTGFTKFSQGVYTMVVGDEWGALTILHFAVEAPNQPPIYNVSTSAQGLWLTAQLNASTIYARSTVSAQITVQNTLDTNVTLPVTNSANSTLSEWAGYDYLCGGSGDYLASILGYALFQGNYVVENFSLAGSPLQLAPPIAVVCVTHGPFSSVTFLPYSDTISIPLFQSFVENATTVASTEYCVSPRPGGSVCGVGGGLSGYWNYTGSGSVLGQQAETSSPYFVYLSPGEYTLAVQDAWGQGLFVHFFVSGLTLPALSLSPIPAATEDRATTFLHLGGERT